MRMSKTLTIFASLFAAAPFTGAAADDAVTPDDIAFDFEHVSCSGADNEIRVLISGVKGNVGQIVADLYPNQEEGFLKKAGRLQQVRFAAKAPQTFFCFKAPAPQGYAIAVYHDENANQKLDKGALGIPSEPFGISNNPKLRFRAPKAKEAAFEVASTGANVEIRMKN